MKRVVIADDSQTARMFIRRCLEIVGLGEAEFVEAADGREALERVREEATDMLVTDLNMPVMDGEMLLRRVRSNPRLACMEVLVVTSAGNTARETELLELGACGVLPKPLSPATLMGVLGPMLEERR